MLQWLKRQFIPCACNDERPRFFCTKNARLLVVAILLLEVGLFVIPTLTYVYNQNLAQVLPSVLAAMTNDERAAHNLPELAVNPVLSRAAEMKARDMAEKGYFAHVSPDGTQPWQWLDMAGYAYDYAGENLAMNFTDSRDITDAWMRSPTHRANIVKDTYTEVGTGVARGTYQGKETIFVAQVYANPAQRAEPAPARAAGDTAPETASDQDEEGRTEDETAQDAEAETDVHAAILGAESGTGSASAEREHVAAPAAPTLIDRMLSSPRHTAGAILLGLLAALVLAFIITIGVRIDVHHPDLVTNALCVIALILALVVGNEIYSRHAAVVSTSIDYAYAEPAPVL